MDLATLETIYNKELQYISSVFERENITYTADDVLIHCDNAWRAIARYLWIDYNADNIMEKKADFTYLIAQLAIAYYNNAIIARGNLRGEQYITQQTLSSRSVTYRSSVIEIDSNGLTAEVKAALPPRRMRVF